MAAETFTSEGNTYNITTYPPAMYSAKHPVILVLHGNAGLNPPFGPQIHGLAKDLAALGYVTAVPQYYPDDEPHLSDGNPHPKVKTLVDAIKNVAARADAYVDRLGLVGYSLGAATAMTYIATNSPGTVEVLVDFFGPTEGNGAIKASADKFPPTIILHNKKDKIVGFEDSEALDKWLKAVDHRLVAYDEDNPQQRHHPFKQNGPADKDSRKQATEWVVQHLPV